jgi:hypothetical protein
MVRLFILAILILMGSVAYNQDSYIQPGLLKASATIAPSKMLNRSVDNIYLSGFLEYHLDKKLSLRGDTYWYVDGQAAKVTDETLSGASRTYFGMFYHANKKNWDNYLGFQSGISLLKFSAISAKLSISPSFALTAGTTFYVWKYFHFFANLTYVNSTAHGIPGGSRRADELIVSAGLGFQVGNRKN